MHWPFLTAAFAVCTAACVQAEPIAFSSPEAQATLLELFTSEGCSSCPPAEAWLGRLKSDPGLWKTIVPVAFHVDYWDGLGWPDRFSRAEFTQRQRRYTAAWGGDSVYTPGVVVNGREWRDWFKSERLPAAGSKKPGKLSLIFDGRTVTVTFGSESDPTRGEGLRAAVAFLAGGLESAVTRGENRGRKLRHDFTVVHFATAKMGNDGRLFRASIPAPAEFPATPNALAAWVDAGDGQPPLQATGGWLREP